MLGDQWLRCLQRFDELVHTKLAIGELLEDAEPQWGREHLEQLGGVRPRHPQKLTDAYLCMHRPLPSAQWSGSTHRRSEKRAKSASVDISVTP